MNSEIEERLASGLVPGKSSRDFSITARSNLPYRKSSLIPCPSKSTSISMQIAILTRNAFHWDLARRYFTLYLHMQLESERTSELIIDFSCMLKDVIISLLKLNLFHDSCEFNFRKG